MSRPCSIMPKEGGKKNAEAANIADGTLILTRRSRSSAVCQELAQLGTARIEDCAS